MIETFWIIAYYVSVLPADEAKIAQYGKEIPLAYESQQACNQQILDLKLQLQAEDDPDKVNYKLDSDLEGNLILIKKEKQNDSTNEIFTYTCVEINYESPT
tara:strand:- start:68 stop:370 length:303 start_codon:yes stop_codon:yes gene_type:complete